MAVGESRTELLHWLNATLDLNYSKVEQCGTGAAYCQLMDSIYGGVPLSKVKFGANLSEYDARSNMKVLQAAFNRNNISKSIEVERLIKCRLQDNLELLQWFKRHWAENADVNGTYDASARRQSGSGIARSRSASRQASRAAVSPSTSYGHEIAATRTSSSGSVRQNVLTVPKRRVVLAASAIGAENGEKPGERRPFTSGAETATKLAETARELDQIRDELADARVLTESLETERNFYFNKLRDIEILTQNIQDQYDKDDKDDSDARRVQALTVLEVVTQIQEILYLTEKGFEVQDMDTELF